MRRVSLEVFVLILLLLIPLSSCTKSEEAQAVDDMIAAIGEVTKSSERAILEAEDAYEQLEESDKNSLSNYEKLQKARTAYDTLCAQEVDKLIEKIGAVTIDSKKDIEAALNKYDSLTEGQKSLVNGYKRLEEIQNEYHTVQIKEVENSIDSIGEVIFTKDCREAIYSARQSYDRLTVDEQEKVSNYSTLVQCEDDFISLGIITTKQLIDAIGEVRFGEECGNAIKAAEDAYYLTSSAAKEQIENYNVLKEAREKYDTLTPIQLNSYRVSSTFLGSSEFYLSATNVTDKIAKEFTIRIFVYDNDNLPVNLSSFGYDVTERLRYSDALKAGAKTKSNVYWYLSASASNIKKVVAYVEDVEFYDGTTWENSNSNFMFSKYNEKILEDNDINILARG